MATLALSELLSAQVIDSTGAVRGRVREAGLLPQHDRVHIAGFIVRTQEGDRLLPREEVESVESRTLHASSGATTWIDFNKSHGEGFLLLERDLLDQQIIDVHGRKVVRVNDVELFPESVNHHIALKLAGVDVGARGAVRRLLQGVVPHVALSALLAKIPPRIIPWEFVDLIETDPSRRVKLRIEYSRLSKLRPADIADILEELAPAERESVFESLKEEVAAHALEEVDPRLQVSLVEALDSERAADIVEEMNSDAAADLLADLPEKTSEEILEGMAPEEREDVEELLEYPENSAAGRMTKDFLSFSPHATVADAIDALREFDGAKETLSTLYLVDKDDHLVGAVPLAALVLAEPEVELASIADPEPLWCPARANEHEAAELFDKYNLLILPVVEKNGNLVGVMTADDVISMLRSKL